MTPTLLQRFGLFGLLCLPPLVFAHTLPIPSFYTEWTAGTFGLLAISGLLGSRPAALEVPRVVWFPLGLSALLIGHAVGGLTIYPSQAVLAVLYLLWAIALMLAARTLSQAWGTQRLTTWLAWALLVSGIISALMALWQLGRFDIELPFLMQSARDVVYGNTAQPNHFANYQALAWAALLYLFVQGELRHALAAPIALLVLTSLGLSGSRSVWLYLSAFAALSAWYFLRHRTRAAKLLLTLSVATLPIFFGLQLILDALGILTPNARLEVLASNLPIRLSLWHDAWAMFVDSPWSGIGYQQYAWHHFLLTLNGTSPFAAMPDFEHLFAENAHNIVLQLLAEFGIAAIPLLAWAAYCFFVALRNIASPTQWWLVSLLAVLGIHSLLEYPLWFANFLGIAAVVFALADSRPYSLTIPVASLRRLSTLFVVGGAFVLTLLWFGFVAIEQMILAWHNARTPQTVALIQHNLRFAQMATLLEPQLNAFLAGLPVEAKEQEILQERVALSAKVMHQMTNAPAVYRHVAWLWMADQKTKALALLDKAVRAYPASRERNVEELQRLAKLYPEIEPLLQAARSAQASAAPLPANAATPAGAGMFRPPGYRTTP